MNSGGIRVGMTAFFAALMAYFEQIRMPILVLLIVMALDYLTGMMKAYVCAELCSRRGIIGILKKLGYFLVVASGMVCDWVLGSALSDFGISLEIGFPIALLIAVWLIINEMISILENLRLIGIPMPRFLMSIVKRLAIAVEEQGEGADANEQGDYDGE